VLNLAREICPHCLYFFEWRQRQDPKNNDASPSQEAKRGSEKASAHLHKVSDLDRFRKSNPDSGTRLIGVSSSPPRSSTTASRGTRMPMRRPGIGRVRVNPNRQCLDQPGLDAFNAGLPDLWALQGGTRGA
jgi:hypothetical protein